MIDYSSQLARHILPALAASGWSWERALRLLAISAAESTLGKSELYKKTRNHTGIICTGNKDIDFEHAKGCYKVSDQYTFRKYGTSYKSLKDTVDLINSAQDYSNAFYAPTPEQFAQRWAASRWCAGDCGPYAQNILSHYEALRNAGRKIGILYAISIVFAAAAAIYYGREGDKRIVAGLGLTSLTLLITTFFL